jgi:hypothetical protein
MLPVICPRVTLDVEVNAVPWPFVNCCDEDTVPFGTPELPGAHEAEIAFTT